MTVASPSRPPMSREWVLKAYKDGRLVSAKAATERHGFPKATVNDWVVRGWLRPAIDGPPRLYLLDDLYNLRHERAAYEPTRQAGKFVQARQPR